METRTGGNHKALTLEAEASRRLSRYEKKISTVVEKRDYKKNESALAIAGDQSYQRALARKLAPFIDATHIVLIGIGGSSQGVEAVFGVRAHLSAKKLFVLDTLDGDKYDACVQFLAEAGALKSIAVVVVTKSGNTTETLMNTSAVCTHLESRFGTEIYSRMVFVTDDNASLGKAAKRKGALSLTFPAAIGGRYSVFSGAGIIPLIILGVDTDALLAGAVRALEPEFRQEARSRAVQLYADVGKGLSVLNFFALDGRYAALGHWYGQLMAESIGKKSTIAGKPFRTTVLPTISVSSDLHSKLQLYLSGPSSILTHFVSSASDEEGGNQEVAWVLDTVPALKNHTRTKVQNAIQTAVIRAYDEAKLPYLHTHFEHASPFELGTFMASAMYEVMLLGQLYGINVFDQPAVEGYKEHTRELLA